MLDPCQWSEVHVRHWIQWAVREFQLEGVDINQFRLNGKQLCDLQHDDFVKYIPFDRNDIFWTHLELLRKCKFVGKVFLFYGYVYILTPMLIYLFFFLPYFLQKWLILGVGIVGSLLF